MRRVLAVVRTLGVAVSCAAGAWMGARPAIGQEPVVDPDWRPAVDQPRYRTGGGPLVLIDGAHHNLHTLDGSYGAFTRLLRADGYRVRALTAPLSAAALATAELLVISNALPAPTAEEADTMGSAFAREEMDALIAWMEAGGGLLLLVDHRPFPRAAAALARRIGLELSDGYALDYEVWDPIVFGRADGTLIEHAITTGAAPGDEAASIVDSVATFYGHAMRALDPAWEPLMVFGPGIEDMDPDGLWEIGEDTRHSDAEGWLQGAARSLGRGRIVVLGEAGMAVAQLVGPRSEPRGMNAPVAAGNATFLLNALAWLTGDARGGGW